ncbi:MAG TPA: alpha/beta fold hydrolase [Kofleriaceae bacterium]|nr:alpha/beta fold hydrolase [Kofleriaceae bacterium]
MHATEEHVTLPDGIRLYARIVDPPAVTAEPTTVIIPNGIVYLDDFAPALPGHRIVAYDLRNRGASDAAPGARGVPDDIEDLEHLRAALGIGRSATLGHSYVGLVAALHAMRYPGAIARLVMIGAPPPDAAATYPPELAYSDGVQAAAFAELGRLQAEREHHDPVAFARAAWDALRPLYVADPANAAKIRWDRAELPNERAFLGYWMATVLPSIQALHLGPEDFARLTAPVLVVHGRKDRSAPFGAALDWLGKLPAARLLEVPEAAHAPWLEDPSVLPAIAAFLGEGGTA